MRSRSESNAEGRQIFAILSAPDSGIRGLSEANRENLSDTHDTPSFTATHNTLSFTESFDNNLPRAVQRIGAIARRLSGKTR